MNDNPRLLWVGDAVAHTGFATVTHSLLEFLHASWNVSVLGINYLGDPHDYPYRIYPASAVHRSRTNQWGMHRIADLCAELRPDVVCVNNDPWNVANFVDVWRKAYIDVPLVAYMPVDAEHQDSERIEYLNLDDAGHGLSLAIWYTEFGRQQAEQAGYTGRNAIVPHGCDAERFHPMVREECRKEILGAPYNDMFIIGAVGRNTFRKRMDLLIEYVGDWLRCHPEKRERTLLYVHSEPAKDGWDLHSLAKYHDVSIATPSGKTSFRGFEPERMPLVYGMCDVIATTNMGEGWGLPTMEGMLCGIPQIVPDFAALGEWTNGMKGSTVDRVRCTSSLTYPTTNSVGRIADKDLFADALETMYLRTSGVDRETLAARRDEIRHDAMAFLMPWEDVATEFDMLLRSVIQKAEPAACSG